MANISKDMNLTELLKKYPETARVFSAYGIGCIGCALASYETIEQGITAHGIDINDFMKDLNELVGAN
ncbi:MAG: disulfide oxidoreductase [Spirochaetes bacterium GWD1_27_9]|nr:MAG: disulfide oxidoreductase [Spirochaetes bacterium GWB1_27_13]OHD28289.1 MAG: disulfide oxidoreductase [Spirochaetes bacterium GWC1_27_15]OHD35056.1 MAG: disulfide oxidoreductase [Spirochaetes bacterium GWD1_27_9]